MGQAARAYRYEDEAPPADPREELERLAADELSHAVSHEWLDMADLLPWADTLPAVEGRPFEVVRSYRWADVEQGDMICDVTVYELPERQGHIVHRSCVIRR